MAGPARSSATRTPIKSRKSPKATIMAQGPLSSSGRQFGQSPDQVQGTNSQYAWSSYTKNKTHRPLGTRSDFTGASPVKHPRPKPSATHPLPSVPVVLSGGAQTLFALSNTAQEDIQGCISDKHAGADQMGHEFMKPTGTRFVFHLRLDDEDKAATNEGLSSEVSEDLSTYINDDSVDAAAPRIVVTSPFSTASMSALDDQLNAVQKRTASALPDSSPCTKSLLREFINADDIDALLPNTGDPVMANEDDWNVFSTPSSWGWTVPSHR
jgi:hypothetical protein